MCAVALSNNLFIIAIGLGIGAMFVRSMTIFLVKQGTLSEYRYLEHGAFYAIIALAAIMYINTFQHIPEVITGVRSEEHTSELQSLMRISYAVFCLKKKTQSTTNKISNIH